VWSHCLLDNIGVCNDDFADEPSECRHRTPTEFRRLELRCERESRCALSWRA
jgi:hypothetical protein